MLGKVRGYSIQLGMNKEWVKWVDNGYFIHFTHFLHIFLKASKERKKRVEIRQVKKVILLGRLKNEEEGGRA